MGYCIENFLLNSLNVVEKYISEQYSKMSYLGVVNMLGIESGV